MLKPAKQLMDMDSRLKSQQKHYHEILEAIRTNDSKKLEAVEPLSEAQPHIDLAS